MAKWQQEQYGQIAGLKARTKAIAKEKEAQKELRKNYTTVVGMAKIAAASKKS